MALIIVGSLVRPAIALAAVFCMYGLDQLGEFSHPWFLQHASFTNVLVGGVLLLGLLRKRESVGQLVSMSPGTTWVVLSLYGYALLSTLWTPAAADAGSRWVSSGPTILLGVFLSPLLITSIDELRDAFRWTALLGSVIAAVFLLFGDWGGRGLALQGAADMVETNPLALASFAGVVIAATLFVGFRRRGVMEWVLRSAVAMLCMLLIIRSGSRGQLIAAVVAILLMLPVRFALTSIRGLLPALLACAAILIAIDVGSSSYTADQGERWTSAGATNDFDGRLHMISKLLSHWQRSPETMLFGLGNSAAIDPAIAGHYVHNMPLEVLGEEGLLGFTLLIVVLGATAVSFVKARRSVHIDVEQAGALAASGAVFIFSLLLSFKQGSLLGNDMVFMSALLVIRAAAAMATQGRVRDVLEHSAETRAGPQFANLMR